MRALIALLSLFLVAGCSSTPLSANGDAALDALAPRPDFSTPQSDLSMPTPPDLTSSAQGDLAGVDLLYPACISVCDHCGPGACCANGPNQGCCNIGEWCDNGNCRCGTIGGACAAGQMCATPGPQSMGQCGSICCGNGVPCPK